MARSLSEAARTKMLRAATDLVLDAGVDGFSVDEVARRSGVAKTTIYRHFPSAKELLVAALDRTMKAPPTPDTGSLREDLLEYLASVRPTLRRRSAAEPVLRDLHRLRTRSRAPGAPAHADARASRTDHDDLRERSRPRRATGRPRLPHHGRDRPGPVHRPIDVPARDARRRRPRSLGRPHAHGARGSNWRTRCRVERERNEHRGDAYETLRVGTPFDSGAGRVVRVQIGPPTRTYVGFHTPRSE